MKVVIDIPKEFENHFNKDRFKDSLKRIQTDFDYSYSFGIAGNYEHELLDMLRVAFKNAEIIESSSSNCTLSPSYPSFFAEDYINLWSTNL